MTVKIDGSNGLLQNYDYQTPLTGFTYTFTTYNTLFMVPAGTLATGTVTMSATPVDGTTVTITSTQQITALTINANTGQSIIGGGAVQLNANTSRTYMYRLANTTWYLTNIAAGNVVTSLNGATGAITQPGGANGQAFTSNGTFTIPAGVTTIKVTVVGGGGGGGGGSASACVYDGRAGGGAGGGGAISYLTSLTPGNTLSVTIGGAGSAGSTAGGNGGTGGTSTVASGTQVISTISGVGGGGGTGATNNFTYNGGVGGLGTGGTINFRGDPGMPSISGQLPGNGGGSFFGGGGAASTTPSAGAAGSNYGGGGAGGYGSGGTSRAGGAGASGVVIFEW